MLGQVNDMISKSSGSRGGAGGQVGNWRHRNMKDSATQFADMKHTNSSGNPYNAGGTSIGNPLNSRGNPYRLKMDVYTQYEQTGLES